MHRSFRCRSARDLIVYPQADIPMLFQVFNDPVSEYFCSIRDALLCHPQDQCCSQFCHLHTTVEEYIGVNQALDKDQRLQDPPCLSSTRVEGDMVITLERAPPCACPSTMCVKGRHCCKKSMRVTSSLTMSIKPCSAATSASSGGPCRAAWLTRMWKGVKAPCLVRTTNQVMHDA